ncbi:hypothetical protein TSOC_003812, partial [Tetrabaena socialis]
DDNVHDLEEPSYQTHRKFMELLLRDSWVRTENPLEANLFYVPATSYSYSSNASPPTNQIARALAYVAQHFPFFNASGGRDHFIWTTGGPPARGRGPGRGTCEAAPPAAGRGPRAGPGSASPRTFGPAGSCSERTGVHGLDHVWQPYESDGVLPYSEFSLRLSKADIPHIVPILRSLPAARVVRMRLAMVRYHRAFLWAPELGGRAYEFTILALEQRLHGLWGRLWGSHRRQR